MPDSSPLFYPFKELFVLTSIFNGMSATVKVSSQVEVCIIKINVLSQIDISFLFNKGFEIFPTADVIFRSCKGIAKYLPSQYLNLMKL